MEESPTPPDAGPGEQTPPVTSPSSVAEDPMEVLYGSGYHVLKDRLKCDGTMLHNKAMEAYQEINAPTKLQYFSKDGRKLLFRNPLNKRRHDTVLEHYVKGVLRNGVIPGVRGQPIAVPRSDSLSSRGDEQSCWLLAHATLSEAVYVAAEREPENKQVLESIKNGLSNVLVLQARTPRDALSYFKDEANKWHTGAQHNVVEFMEMAMEASNSWTAHCAIHSIKVRECAAAGPNTYGRQMERFILSKYPCFQGVWDHYQNTIAFVNIMKKRNIFQQWCRYLEQNAQFLNPKLSNQNPLIVRNMHRCSQVITGFAKTYDVEIIDEILMELLKLTVPIEGRDHWPQVFQDHSGYRTKGFNTPMAESKLYIRAAQQAAKAAQNPAVTHLVVLRFCTINV